MSDLEKTFSAEELEQIRNDPQLRELFDSVGGSVAFPDSPSKDSLLKVFRDILSFKDDDFDKISRAGNLKDFELGGIRLSVRDYLGIASFAESERLGSVAGFLRGRSNIIFNTSLSRAAKLLNVLVTQRRLSGVLEPKRFETKSGLFGSKTVESGGDDL